MSQISSDRNINPGSQSCNITQSRVACRLAYKSAATTFLTLEEALVMLTALGLLREKTP